MRGLRYILGIKHSYYSRTSNEDVLRRANLAFNKVTDNQITWEQFRVQNPTCKEIKMASDFIKEQQLKLLGHVLRREVTHPLRKGAITETLERPRQLYNRVGKQRYQWVDDNLERVCWMFN